MRNHIPPLLSGLNASVSEQHIKLAGMAVAVWKPRSEKRSVPLIIFSHGFHGRNTQSRFIMNALCDAGFLVVAPNHKDAMGERDRLSKPAMPLERPDTWNESTYKDRHDDIVKLITALHADRRWNDIIDWSKVGLIGHSLGGYAVLGLAGAWPTWKLPYVKAVLALSPYAQPFTSQHTLGALTIPTMYQSGSRDFGVAPFLKRPGGTYDQTSSPKYYVEFEHTSHFGWTNFQHDQALRDAIDHYSVAFLNRYVKGDRTTDLKSRLPPVSAYQYSSDARTVSP